MLPGGVRELLGDSSRGVLGLRILFVPDEEAVGEEGNEGKKGKGEGGGGVASGWPRVSGLLPWGMPSQGMSTPVIIVLFFFSLFCNLFL